MTQGTKAGVNYYDGSATGKVGKAQKGGASGGAGGDASHIGGGRSMPSDKQPSGEKAGGTENLQADAAKVRAPLSGPSVSHTDSRPSVVKVADGLSVPSRVKQP